MLAAGCGPELDVEPGPSGESEGAYTSARGTLLDFEFDGELLGPSAFGNEARIKDQLLYTIGHLNADTGVGRLDRLALSNVRTEAAGGLTLVRYHARLPVSWGKGGTLPKTYVLTLPRRMDSTGLSAFFTRYATTCVDASAHDNSVGIYWYYYRPARSGCALAPEDVVKATATATVSPENSVNRYPEFDRIWSDRALKVLVIFGKVEDGATTSADRGIWSYNQFVKRMKSDLPGTTTTPATFPTDPGIAVPRITVDSALPDGRTASITSFLVDNVREGGPEFERQYNELSTDADVIIYNGHAGLGQNVRKLATMGRFKAGMYQIFYMNGCDTFAYVDGSLAQTRRALNPDDPTGTKYMEIITNSMPPRWDALPINSISLVKDLLNVAAPRSYKQILSRFDQSGLVVVTGEEDNVFKP